jgi:hypothetical protein
MTMMILPVLEGGSMEVVVLRIEVVVWRWWYGGGGMEVVVWRWWYGGGGMEVVGWRWWDGGD